MPDARHFSIRGTIALVALIFVFLSCATASAQTDAPLPYASPQDSLSFFSSGDESSAFLGVSVEEEVDHDEGGARITHVVDESPAFDAGLEDGDIIVRIEGEPVRGPRGLTRRLADHEPGDSVEIGVVRDGRERSFAVELAERKRYNLAWAFDTGAIADQVQESLARVGVCGDDDCGTFAWHGYKRPILGVELASVTPELRAHLGGAEDTGILVAKVLPGMPAAEADIRVGDLIVAIDGAPVSSAGSILRKLSGKQGETVTVDVIRDRVPQSIDVSLPESDTRPSGPRARRLERADPALTSS